MPVRATRRRAPVPFPDPRPAICRLRARVAGYAYRAMAFKTPQEITEAGVETGVTKAPLRRDKMLVGGFLAGAYIAFAGSARDRGHRPAWTRRRGARCPRSFTGAVFALGLMLVIIAGSELLTGNMALLPLAAVRAPRRPWRRLGELRLGARRQPARLAVRRLLPGREVRRLTAERRSRG